MVNGTDLHAQTTIHSITETLRKKDRRKVLCEGKPPFIWPPTMCPAKILNFFNFFHLRVIDQTLMYAKLAETK